MDVADTRFGTRGRDRDELAIQIHNLFKRFLEEYFDETEEHSAPRAKYAADALELLLDHRNSLFIDFKDVEMFDQNMAEDIIGDYYRFYPYLCLALAAYVREERIRQAEGEMDPDIGPTERLAEREHLKRELDKPQIRNKHYYIGFYNLANRDNIRDLSCTRIGTLTRVSGQVVRAHTVHPELVVGCFVCEDCLTEQYCQQQFRYSTPTLCANDNCNNRTRFRLILDKSRFTDFQRLRIQESQEELPRGCIPRSFDVIIRGADQVECIQPGDQCDFIGTLIAAPDVGHMMSGIFGTVSNELSSGSGVTGLKQLGVKEMTHSLAFLANACIRDGQTKPCFNNNEENDQDLYGTAGLHVSDFTKEEILKIERMGQDPNLLDKMSQSLFSSVYGSDDVKRGIILQLLGGVSKRTQTGTKLRGDINICLVGDPSTAKSQFLKIVTDFAPFKAVYTSGKGCSASGLTAAVVRDTDGGFVIEAGALMLADRGICCIDEFDKMDLKDQIAIHEAMEQQTISITKAGVSATLNARASILAAANPISGKYDVTRDLRSNVNFSLPIMSRFDLFFVLIDPRQADNDKAIASRILDMHYTLANPKENEEKIAYSFEDIKLYLRFARKYHPKMGTDAEEHFVREYVRLRKHCLHSRKAWRITVRQLESLIRLSEAIARAHCDEIVRPAYIKMASKLIEKTQVQVGESEVELEENADKLNINELTGGDVPKTNGLSQGMYEGELESQRLPPSQQIEESKQGTRLDIKYYVSMGQLLVGRLKALEFENQLTISRSDLIDWYLQQCIADINTEEDLIAKKELCEKVLYHLTNKAAVLLELREDGNIITRPDGGSQDQDTEQPSDDETRLIMLNPNLDADEYFNQVVS